MEHHILIDYENVQPQLVPNQPNTEVTLFLGPHQKRLPADLVESMQALGDRGRYVRVTAQGPDALDFHIAYYIGTLTTERREVSIEIISRDKGFDPLIEHLRAKSINARRSITPVSGQASTRSGPAAVPEAVRLVVRNLNRRGVHRPARVSTLQNTIKNHLGDDNELAVTVVSVLEQERWVEYHGDRVAYALPEVI